MEQFGAGSWAKGIQTLPQSALELVGSHGSSLRRREDCPRRRIYGRVTVSRAGALTAGTREVTMPRTCGKGRTWAVYSCCYRRSRLA